MWSRTWSILPTEVKIQQAKSLQYAGVVGAALAGFRCKTDDNQGKVIGKKDSLYITIIIIFHPVVNVNNVI